MKRKLQDYPILSREWQLRIGIAVAVFGVLLFVRTTFGAEPKRKPPAKADAVLDALAKSDPLAEAAREIEQRLKEIQESDEPPFKKQAELSKFVGEFNRAKKTVTVRYVIESIRPPSRDGWQTITIKHPSNFHKPKDVPTLVRNQPISFLTTVAGDVAVTSGSLRLTDVEPLFNATKKDTSINTTAFSIESEYRGTKTTKKMYLALDVSGVSFEKADAPKPLKK